MSLKSKFVSGDPLILDYTPGADVVGGDVILLSSSVRIAHGDIASGELGAVSAGGAIYDIESDGSDPADGQNVYWNNSSKKVTTTASGNTLIGIAVGAQTLADGDYMRVAVDLQTEGT